MGTPPAEHTGRKPCKRYFSRTRKLSRSRADPEISCIASARRPNGIHESVCTSYELVSGFVDLEQYVGERVTIQGVAVPGPGDPSKPPLLNVTQIQPTDGGGDNDPPVNDKATLSYELTVDGDPPAGAAFYGHLHTGEGGPGKYVPLTDPDEDRVYTGSTTVDRFGPGPRPVPPSVEPVSLPVRIVQESGANIEVIKDFGTVKVDGDKTFSASVSFPV